MKNAKKSKQAKAAVKTTKTNKQGPGKLSRLFRNKKIVILVVFVLIFAIAGSYRLYSTSAASTTKTADSCRANGVVLRRGSTGGCVEVVQRLVTAFRNIQDPTWPILQYDGKYGPLTESAVRKYQQHERITVDGVVGTQTWDKLVHECRERYQVFGSVYTGCAYAQGSR